MINEPSFLANKAGWIEVVCGGMFSGMMANFSQRIVENDEKVLVGENESYEPRARHCFRPPVDIKRGKPLPPIQKLNPQSHTKQDD